MGDAKCWVQPDCEESLQDNGEYDRVPEVKQVIRATCITFALEAGRIDKLGKYTPETAGA
jgi:hypothetical protein